MAYVSLDDICTKSVDEIFKQMSRPYVVGDDGEKQPEPDISPKELVKQLKRRLKGAFAPGKDQIYLGQVIRVDGKFIKVTGVLPSSGRAFFLIPDVKKTFSLPIWFLTGEKPAIKYKKGDTVTVEGKEFPIVYVNPASNSIQLDVNGILKRISLNKIESLTLFKLTGEEMRSED